MSKRFTTYQIIADILSFTTSNTSLEATLSAADVDWDAIVVHGSRQLVIPTLYCRLKQRQLLHLLPEDLDLYLHDITSQNRKRNKAILKEVTMLSTLFKKHHIEHVFLKGTALLASGYYEDIAERMIGDIDILVATKQLDKAFELLQQHSFKPLPQNFGSHYFEHKHLPRMTTNKYIAAVELHRKLFVTYKKKELSNALVLNNKRIQNDVFVPSTQNLIEHNILNHEINDDGYRYHSMNFRTVYDTIMILKTNTLNNTQISDVFVQFNNNKYLTNFFKKLNVFCDDFKLFFNKSANHIFTLKLKYKIIHKLWLKGAFTGHLFYIICHRLGFWISNRAYRKDLWKDRHRVFSNYRSYLSNFKFTRTQKN
ncbi:nucleotidyltransferase family protein [Flavobacteriaceae bacterium]|nr:nucleotidyltransferase family protein [Flavobacteriaceae bacterium]